MTPEQSPCPSEISPPNADLAQASLHPWKQSETTDETKQAEYRKAFLLQQQRRACPGYGDDGTLFG